MLPGCEKTQAESLKAAFLKALDEISKSLHAEFDVEASIGYEVVLCGEKSLNECINNADEKMYQFKKARKAQRKEVLFLGTGCPVPIFSEMIAKVRKIP